MKQENYSNIWCSHYCTAQKNNLNEAFIYARIAVSKKVIDISLKRTTLCSLWDSKRECINSKTPEAKQINKFIDDTRYG